MFGRDAKALGLQAPETDSGTGRQDETPGGRTLVRGRRDAASTGGAGLKTQPPGGQRVWSEAARLPKPRGGKSSPTCE